MIHVITVEDRVVDILRGKTENMEQEYDRWVHSVIGFEPSTVTNAGKTLFRKWHQSRASLKVRDFIKHLETKGFKKVKYEETDLGI